MSLVIEKERDALTAKLNDMTIIAELAQEEHKITKAKLAEAQKDTERLDWMEANPDKTANDGFKVWRMASFWELRECIDLHRARKEHHEY